MLKRILLALTLAASLGGAVLACNNPAGTSTPASVIPTTPAASDNGSSEPSAGSSEPSTSADPSPSAS